MRLWIEFLSGAVLVWAVSLPGTDPAIRLGVVAATLVWGIVTATRPRRVR